MDNIKIPKDDNLVILKDIAGSYGFSRQHQTLSFLTRFNKALFKETYDPVLFNDHRLIQQVYRKLKEMIDIKKITTGAALAELLHKTIDKEAYTFLALSKTKTNNPTDAAMMDAINIESIQFLKASRKKAGSPMAHIEVVEATYDLLQPLEQVQEVEIRIPGKATKREFPRSKKKLTQRKRSNRPTSRQNSFKKNMTQRG